MQTNENRRTRAAAEIRAELARLKKPQSWLSADTGIKKTTLRQRLTGSTPGLTLDEIDSITAALGIPLVEFISRTDVAA